VPLFGVCLLALCLDLRWLVFELGAVGFYLTKIPILVGFLLGFLPMFGLPALCLTYWVHALLSGPMLGLVYLVIGLSALCY